MSRWGNPRIWVRGTYHSNRRLLSYHLGKGFGNSGVNLSSNWGGHSPPYPVVATGDSTPSHRWPSPVDSMSRRLHRGGRFRRWLGQRFGGDEALGDRAWRRILHLWGAGAIVYYLLPDNLVGDFTRFDLLLLLLLTMLLLEALRLGGAIEIPTVRPYEQKRIASFAFFAIALAIALVVFPTPVGAAAILGVSWIDPLVGEMRVHPTGRRLYPWLPGALYMGLAASMLLVFGHASLVGALLVGSAMAVVALASEYPKLPWLDDDLAMTILPALAAWGLIVTVPWLSITIH